MHEAGRDALRAIHQRSVDVLLALHVLHLKLQAAILVQRIQALERRIGARKAGR